MTGTPDDGRKRICYLTPHELRRLDWAVQPVVRAFADDCAFNARAYLVGSALTRDDYRDIDVRLVLTDKAFKKLTGVTGDVPYAAVLRDRHHVLNVAFTALIDQAANLRRPVDFQFQSASENAEFDGPRNPLGGR